MRIRQLDDILANKIAAGEVVERPANVVKELVENSIDANATKIDIIIEDGGMQLIEIIDNGIGMDDEDARLCFSRHATSKIKNDQDLFCIQTLGFRGEAIPSIASISHFTLKTSDGSHGSTVFYEFGKFIEQKQSDLKRGTTITVSRLFQNVPARLKYMKSVTTEFSAIQKYVESLALTHPDIAFCLSHNGKEHLKTNGNGNLLEVIARVNKFSVARNMFEVNFGDHEFTISGYIGKISETRSTKSEIITMVNHRVVKNKTTIEAIAKAYEPFMEKKRFPVAVINIEVDPYLVDVNVHPSKLEVRFSKDDDLRDLIIEGIRSAIKGVDQTYKVQSERTVFKPKLEQMDLDIDFTELVPEVKPQVVIKEVKKEYKVEQPVIHQEKQEIVVEKEVVEEKPITPVEPVIQEEIKEVKVEPVKVMKKKIFVKGQVHGTYIIGEDETGMYLIDQHAAKERVNYEYFLEKYSHPNMAMRDLLIPITVEYPLSECMILEERKELFKEVGIHLEPFGNGFIIKQLPMWMNNINEHIFIEDMVQQVLKDQKINILALQEHAIATLSCKASVKGNTHLELEAMQAIVDQLMCCDNPYVCPHGRPTIIHYSSYELEKLFKRVV